MSNTQLKTLLAKGIEEDLSYLELRAYLIDFKEQGGQPEEALRILEELHLTVTDENTGNRLLELMDLVEGAGIKSLKIW